MSRAKNTLLLLRIGIVFLGIASFFHLAGHWEIATRAEGFIACAHFHGPSDSNSDESPLGDHNKGCPAHDHSPAILQSTLLFSPEPIVLASPEKDATPPPPVHRKIDQPPRLS